MTIKEALRLVQAFYEKAVTHRAFADTCKCLEKAEHIIIILL